VQGLLLLLPVVAMAVRGGLRQEEVVETTVVIRQGLR